MNFYNDKIINKLNKKKCLFQDLNQLQYQITEYCPNSDSEQSSDLKSFFMLFKYENIDEKDNNSSFVFGIPTPNFIETESLYFKYIESILVDIVAENTTSYILLNGSGFQITATSEQIKKLKSAMKENNAILVSSVFFGHKNKGTSLFGDLKIRFNLNVYELEDGYVRCEVTSLNPNYKFEDGCLRCDIPSLYTNHEFINFKESIEYLMSLYSFYFIKEDNFSLVFDSEYPINEVDYFKNKIDNIFSIL